MHALRKKASSERGASITFALLIFLVCAVVSSVVIVAATAAAGRMSERAATDQRYYAVTSAAGLLRDDFNDKTVTVEHTIDSAGAVSMSPKASKLVSTSAPASALTLANYSVLSDASELLVGKIASKTADSNTPDRELELTSDVASTTANLNCSIREYVLADKKQVVFEIRNTPDASATKQVVYTMYVIFNANIHQTNAQSKVTTTIEWTLGSIGKGTAQSVL